MTTPTTFQIGATSSMADLETVLSAIVPLEPDWSYQPFSTSIKLADGTTQGNGFPIIKWRFNQLTLSQRETLRTYCPVPNLSKADVYINTLINETSSGTQTWKTFKCVLNWPTEDEDIQAGRNLGVILVFTHCEVQP